jgi:putative hemolysin
LLLDISIIMILLVFSGFFSGSETALFSLSSIQRERIKRTDYKKALLINKLLSRPRKLIVSILIGNDMVNIAASVIATSLLVSFYNDNGEWIAMAIMTPVTLIFAEVIPKTLAMTYNERVAPLVSKPLYFFSQLIFPLRFLLYNISVIISKIAGFEKRNISSAIMENEFRELVDQSHESGEINRAERDLIHNVFEFSDTCAFEVMTPLNEIFSLSDDSTIDIAVKAVQQRLFLRIPVYRNRFDNIVGILYAKDLLKVNMGKSGAGEMTIRQIYRKPFFVDENIKTDDLFHILKKKRVHIAICINRQGRVTGLLTMEDLLGELFGEIYDEHDMVT